MLSSILRFPVKCWGTCRPLSLLMLTYSLNPMLVWVLSSKAFQFLTNFTYYSMMKLKRTTVVKCNKKYVLIVNKMKFFFFPLGSEIKKGK